MRILMLLVGLFMLQQAQGMNYTSYFIGNTTDLVASPLGGTCLMGGASESDEAMIWFLQRAGGGDVLVLRASGTDGYNDYLYSDLGVSVNSVETIVFHNANASNEAYIHTRIQQAEAIWIAGGDQWDYISYWRNTPVETYINDAITNRSIVIGGTSAGMAIMGNYYFTAENGTVTSNQALNNPYHSNATIGAGDFLDLPYLSSVITDTHYDNPNRKGRHATFLARILTDSGVEARGIACEEYTAVCIDANGLAKVYGEYPSYNDYAYFIQTNCELVNRNPETCTAGSPLTWDLGQEAIRIYRVPGTTTGSNTFDLTNWETGSGGLWGDWSVQSGSFQENAGQPLMCLVLPVELLHFDARELGGHQVRLSWSTALEEAFDAFQIEHSSDASHWKEIGTIKGKGNDSYYEWVHTDVGFGLHYYRLKMLDEDGSWQYSEVSSLRMEAVNEILIYPNPSIGTISIENNHSDQVQCRLFDSLGRQLGATLSIPSRGTHSISPLPPGCYWVHMLLPSGLVRVEQVLVH